jgi:hypothetical protein
MFKSRMLGMRLQLSGVAWYVQDPEFHLQHCKRKKGRERERERKEERKE